ncbi:MAG: Na+/H+ antiporter subunit E [Candidatus Promineifilaceae bacterium]|nr:Na+/H+ antiporter subunit E [Candidatus Promineifilaceae bacterium]
MRYLKWILPLSVLYIALTGNGEPLNWLLGVLLALGITALLRPDPAPIGWAHLPAASLAAVQFVLSLLADLVVSSLLVARMLLRRQLPLRQGVFALPTGSPAEAVTVLSAQAITLTPGEMVIEIDEDGVMYTHSLDVVTSAESEPRDQERRVGQLSRIVRC